MHDEKLVLSKDRQLSMTAVQYMMESFLKTFYDFYGRSSNKCSFLLQVYLVGDPIQLPATVISKRAVSYGYDVSLFKRLQQAGYPVQVILLLLS